jgi:hypothetical protein
VRVFRQKFTLEDAIGSHACSLEALTCVWPNGIPLGCSLLLPVDTVNSVQTLKALLFFYHENDYWNMTVDDNGGAGAVLAFVPKLSRLEECH